MMRPTLTDITADDMVNLFAVNPLAQAQVLGFVKDRRIAELEAELKQAGGNHDASPHQNGAKEEGNQAGQGWQDHESRKEAPEKVS
jgi:hypothetical protein